MPRALTLGLWLLGVALGAAAAEPQRYELSLSPQGSNVYKVDGRDLFILTERCAVATTAQAGAGALTPRQQPGADSVLRFADGRSCKVRGVYGPLVLANDRYGLTLARRGRDWYEAVGTDMFLRTRLCTRMTLGERSVLVVLAKDDLKLLFPDGSACEVLSAYSRLKP